MPGVELYFMQSSGGLAEAHAFQGKDAILSGPAGGIVGMVRTAELGLERDGAKSLQVIGFDMGGTSTDVSHYAGEFERAFETKVAGVRVRAPMMAIHTVAAGGGSVLAFDGARFRVGPESAGANPGPACYRRGGPLTVTDANLALGKIQPAFFPRVFGPRGDEALDGDVVAARWRARSRRRPASRSPRKRSLPASSTSPSAAWPTRSRRSRSRAATTSPATRCSASAAPAASTPASSPTRWRWSASTSIRSPACCRLTAWASPIRR
jgi:5-oxoprolinase (ATP-hydrolysing)